MSGALLRGVALPIRALWSPGATLDEAGAHRALVAPASLVLLLALLGAMALPRLLALLDTALVPTGQAPLDAHLGVLRVGLTRLLLVERLVVPLPYLAGCAVLWLVAASLFGGRVRAGAIAAVLALGAAPLLVQRAGELAVVLAAPGASVAAGDVAGLPARFNVGLAGALAAWGIAAPGWLGVVAEAANGIGVWVVALWAWGLSRLDRDASRSARAGRTTWWGVAAATAYAAGWAMYAGLYPFLLLVVMGAP